MRMGRGSAREKVRDKERVRDGREKKERKACLNWPVWPRWVVMPNPASIVGLALHASRAFGQPQLTLVCSLAVSNVRPGRAVPPTSRLYTSGGLSGGGGGGARVRLVPLVFVWTSVLFR